MCEKKGSCKGKCRGCTKPIKAPHPLTYREQCARLAAAYPELAGVIAKGGAGHTPPDSHAPIFFDNDMRLELRPEESPEDFAKRVEDKLVAELLELRSLIPAARLQAEGL